MFMSGLHENGKETNMNDQFKSAIRNAIDGCNKWLIAYDDEVIELDGCHSETKDVVQAKVLIEELGLPTSRLPNRKMITIVVEDVPAFSRDELDINDEAVGIMAPLIKRYAREDN
jgi:hypothetical protein